MKKFVISILITLAIASPVFAYTVQPGDTPFSLWGKNWPTELSKYGISDPHKLPVGLNITKNESFGALVPTSPALIDTYLVSGISTTDSSMTLSSGVTKAGVTLSGLMCFTIDVNTPSVEYVCGTAAGTSITALSRGIDLTNPNTTSTALAFVHRRFASVQVSDYPTLQFLVRKVNGLDAFNSALLYDTSTAQTIVSSNPNQIASVYFVASTSYAGTVNAANGTKGIVEAGTPTQIASSTPTGSSGALLAPVSTMTTSSWYTAGKYIPVTQNNGQIDPMFINTSSPYLWTASSTHTAASTTITHLVINSTTTLINGVTYNFPPTQGASSSVWRNDGNGNLFSQLPDMYDYIATSTAISTSTINISGVPACTDFRILAFITGGVTADLRFNNDATAGNYTWRINDLGGTGGNNQAAAIGGIRLATNASSTIATQIDVTNDASQQKMVTINGTYLAGQNQNFQGAAAWTNNSNAINFITLRTESGSFSAGTRMKVFCEN